MPDHAAAGRTDRIRLYSFFNSSASFRVRIALHLKGVAHEIVPVDIRSGAQHSETYLEEIAPSPLVPALEADGQRISQSLAIIDWLDRRFPSPLLIPDEAVARAKVLAFANIVACDIHPLNNLRVLRYLEQELHLDADTRQHWYQHWIDLGLAAVENMLAHADSNGSFCFGDTPTLADCCLIPQIANAIRMKCDLSAYPRAMAIHEHAMTLEPFRRASPAAQPDFLST